MKYDNDIICIGLGPAGMAVSIMGSEMGLSVCSIEKHKIGGECMNVGCIPSKALLKMAHVRAFFDKLDVMELENSPKPAVKKPFLRIADYIKYINEKKTVGMFHKVRLILGKGEAKFVDPHTVEVAGEKISAKKIFIAVGTKPFIPPIEGLDKIDYLTNEKIFSLTEIPKSLVIIGGGAIGCEISQAFSRLGCKCSMIHVGEHLIPNGDEDAGRILESVFKEEGIDVYNGKRILKVENSEGGVTLYAEGGITITAEKLLVCAGRQPVHTELGLENAGVKYDKTAVKVNRKLQTSRGHIYAVGDCNGYYLLSHAAMHQGMIAIMNSMMPGPFKFSFDKFVVPWTVFTEPEISRVGMSEAELERCNIKYEVVEVKYEDYGAAIAENVGIGMVKSLVGPTGRIYGVTIVGHGSGEMINEWALAIQEKIPIWKIMMLQHSFPTMGFLTKRNSEAWMMNKMGSKFLRKMCKFMFSLG